MMVDVRSMAEYIISIHAPREGSDCTACGLVVAQGKISIHAPREGSDIRPSTMLTP